MSSSSISFGTSKKAMAINVEGQYYGTFAEIGAGQEVARHFFQAGRASNTIAKTISAYDMTMSDAIYGKESSGRYVCESRIHKMLDHEYELLSERLEDEHGPKKCFFAFANTVATNRGHGWIGVRYQTSENADPTDLIVHVNMKDNTRLQQQEALGILGVNILYACIHFHFKPKEFVQSLKDNLGRDRIAIDVLRFSGAHCEHINERLMSLDLVQNNLTNAILFRKDGHIHQVAEALFDKPTLIIRGEFRPITNTNLDIIKSGLEQFKKDLPKDSPEPVVLCEMTMANFEQISDTNENLEQDFLQRVETLSEMGLSVFVSKLGHYYKVSNFVRQFTKRNLAFLVGANQLEYLFEPNTHPELNGGLLEACGQLFDSDTKVYVFPYKTDLTCLTTKSFFPDTKVLKLYEHLLIDHLVDLTNCDEVKASTLASEVRKSLKLKTNTWKALVPEKVVQLITEKKFFGFK